MLIGSGLGLGDPVVEGPELFPGQLRPVTFDTPLSTMTIQMGPQTSVLAKIAPKKVGANGKVTIWGLPPLVAYAIMAVILAGAGLWTYQKIKGRRASNPKRRSTPRGKRARYKR